MKYTIEYQYGSYSGTEVVWAEDAPQALALLWKRLRPHMTLPMAYKSARIISVEPDAEEEESDASAQAD